VVIDHPNSFERSGAEAVGTVASMRQRVRFRASSPDATSLYLLVGQADGSPTMLAQMDQVERGQWALSVPLTPGVYRYRCYANDGAMTRYVPPVEPGDLPFQMAGLDALFVVPAAPKVIGAQSNRIRGN
jgi:1,4-alpha-glucan branching enzyme